MKAGNYFELVRHISRLSANPGLCRELGRNARLCFDMECNPELSINKWKDVIRVVEDGANGVQV